MNMEDIDEHIGHRYVPGHEREHCDWVCDVLQTSMQFWETIAIVVGGVLVFSILYGIRRLMKAMAEERTTVRPRTDQEKRDHLRTMREMRQGR